MLQNHSPFKIGATLEKGHLRLSSSRALSGIDEKTEKCPPMVNLRTTSFAFARRSLTKIATKIPRKSRLRYFGKRVATHVSALHYCERCAAYRSIRLYKSRQILEIYQSNVYGYSAQDQPTCGFYKSSTHNSECRGQRIPIAM